MRKPRQVWIVELRYHTESDKATIYPISINCSSHRDFHSTHLCLAVFSTRAQARRFMLERVNRFNNELHPRKKGEYTGYKISRVKISE